MNCLVIVIKFALDRAAEAPMSQRDLFAPRFPPSCFIGPDIKIKFAGNEDFEIQGDQERYVLKLPGEMLITLFPCRSVI